MVFRWTEQAAVEAEVVLGEEGTKTTEGGVEEGEALEKSPGESEQPSESITHDIEAKAVELVQEAGAGETESQTAAPGGQADEVEIIDYH